MTTRVNPLLLAFLLTAALLQGCSFDSPSEYKNARRGKPLEVPPDLATVSGNATYSMPSNSTYSQYNNEVQTQKEKKVVAESILPSPEGVKLEKSGRQRWLVVQAPVEKVWPVVMEFWGDLGFPVSVESKQSGVIETEWVDPGTLYKGIDSSALDKFQKWMDKLGALDRRQKFRMRLERGNTSEVTEIYLNHLLLNRNPKENKIVYKTIYGDVDSGFTRDEVVRKNMTPEQLALADDIDAEILRLLTVKLGVSQQQSYKIVTKAQESQYARMEKDASGNTVIALTDPFDRSWQRTGQALDRIGFMIEDKNRAQGLYFIKYVDLENAAAAEAKNKEEKSWFSWLKFWGGDEKKVKLDMPDKYILKVAAGEGKTLVYLSDEQSKPQDTEISRRILSMLYDQLK